MDKNKKLVCLLALSHVSHKNRSGREKRPRRCWVRDIFLRRKNQGAFHNLVQEMRLSDTNKYQNYLRMSPTQFDALLELVGPVILRLHVRREPVSPAERLAVCLRYLASGDSMVSISYAFRLGTQTVSDIIKETCTALWDVLREKVFIVQTEENWKAVSNQFRDVWNLSHCIGAVDGKHIVIQAPENSGSQFYNYKGTHSIVLLGVCDAQYKFIAVDIGAQGRQSDGGVFRSSEFGNRLLTSRLNLPPMSEIETGADPMPYYIVGDSAFPLTMNLMRPYPGTLLPQYKRIFNYRLSRGRRVSENTFGILANRWRILRKPIIASIQSVEAMTCAIIVLHNWLMLNKEHATYCPPNLVDREDNQGNVIPGEWRQDATWDHNSHLTRVGSNMYKRSAEKIREDLACFFYSEGAVEFQWDK